MLKKLLFVCLILLSCAIHGQNAQLAMQYFNSGEYEKAASIFEDLWKKQTGNDYYFNKYMESLQALNQNDKIYQILNQQIKQNPNTNAYVKLGAFEERKQNLKAANKAYKNAIQVVEKQTAAITRLAQEFEKYGRDTLAINTYQHGRKILKNDKLFSYNLGALHYKTGNIKGMTNEFLISLEENPSRLTTIKRLFQRYLTTDQDLKVFQAEIFKRIQKDPSTTHYPDLLAWSFIQEKNYGAALRQLKALDKRNDENGSRIYQLANTATNDNDYDVAVDAYQYIIQEKGKNSPFYFIAQEAILDVRLKKITRSSNYQEADVDSVLKGYDNFLKTNTLNPNTASIALKQAEVYALYKNDLDKALSILQNIIGLSGIQAKVRDQAKIKLADYKLISGDQWEATLLYSQIDKANPEAAIGETARFKNAMLSYFIGDFEWAQEQFDILKSATSRFISNDAIDRSVFIMDNLNLDTTAHPLSLFAEAELLQFQNQDKASIQKLDSIKLLYPEHGLLDDILYVKGQIAEEQLNYEQAVSFYQEIVDDYPEEIRADNALYRLGEIYNDILLDKTKASSYYEKLFLEYESSTFASEARKKYRLLRGDQIN